MQVWDDEREPTWLIRLASPLLFCDTKSRGSTGNIFPPIGNESECALVQGKVGSALEAAARAGDTVDRMLFTTSWGPRRIELPYKTSVQAVHGTGNTHCVNKS